jgi:putative FmdB family regulatory protein
MPMYEYICTCGANREVVQKVSELDTIKVMCECGLKMIRIISKIQAKPKSPCP